MLDLGDRCSPFNQTVQAVRHSTIDYQAYKKPFKQRLSTFELDNGMHKQRSSQIKIEKDMKIKRMLSKTGIGYNLAKNYATDL